MPALEQADLAVRLQLPRPGPLGPMAARVLAWLPMVLVWFGFSNTAIEAVILYTVFFPVAFNTMAGVRTVPGQLVNAVRVLGASRARLVRDVWLPGSLPGVVVGMRMGIAYGW